MKSFKHYEALCQELASSLNIKFPEANGIAFGHIGNLQDDSDERTWSFFTGIEVTNSLGRRVVASFGHEPTRSIEYLYDKAQFGLERFITSATSKKYNTEVNLNDWREATSRTKEFFHGAILEKIYGGTEVFAPYEMTIIKQDDGKFVPVHGCTKMEPVSTIEQAKQKLDSYYDDLSGNQKYKAGKEPSSEGSKKSSKVRP